MLLAAEAVGGDTHHVAVEQFLQLAELPAPDEWDFTEDLREKYQRGSRARLQEFHRSVTEALREVVRPVAAGKDVGPEELKRSLQLEGPPPPDTPPATRRQVDSRVVDGAWHVSAEIHINDRTKRRSVKRRLWLDVDSGSPIPVR